MDLDEKIGQLFMVAAYSNRDQAHEREILELVEKYKIGGLIFFQGGPVRQSILSNRYQSRADIPLLVAMDAEWGVGMRLDSTIRYPFQMGLGAIQDNHLIYEMGQEIARQFKRLGMHVNFAPVIDINNNANNPVINFRSFGEDKHNVSEKGVAYMKGLQDHGVLACGKHFPGHGDTDVDSHKDLPIIAHDMERLNSVELFPFRELMDEGLGSVMVAHLNIPVLDSTFNLPSTLSAPIVKGLLKDSLRFQGLVFTDALNMEGVAKYYEQGEVDLKALMAGNDILLFSLNVQKGIELIRNAILDQTISLEEIDKRVKKVLHLKYWVGLHQYKPVETERLIDDLNNANARLLNRKLVEASLTVIRNDNNIVPLKKLDTLQLASVTIGDSQKEIFDRRLSSYTHVDHIHISGEEQTDEILNQIASNDVVILNMTGLSQYASRNFGLSDKKLNLINEIIRYKPVILVWHGNPYGLARLKSLDQSAAVIITYQENAITFDLGAQLIFGGVGANGKLPVAINPSYPAGKGIPTRGNMRLGYTIPEEVHLNGNFLSVKIDSLAEYTLEQEVAPGLQVLIARYGKVVFHKAYGHHTYDRLREVKTTDIYDFASVTKITSALPGLMKMHDMEKFDLDATIGEYVDFFDRRNKKDLIIRRILSHNAGLQSWIPYWQTTLKKNGKYKRNTLSNDSSSRFTIKLTDDLYLYNNYKKKIYRMILKSPVNPGQGYVYSGLSFYIWPEVLENLTGEEYESYLKNTFYRPLGANTLTFNPYKHFSLSQIVPTENDTFFRKVQIHGVVHDEGAAMMDGLSANAGLFGSANDLAKLMQMYLNMGTYGGERFISGNTLKKFTFCHYCNEGIRRGLGFDKPLLENKERGIPAVNASANSFGHSGYTGMFTWADPDSGILFVFCSNRVYPTRANNKIAELSIRPKMHQAVYDSILD
jgi:beta-glucosidase-like glycosyl hydrolase/CubicO group peptidase (beta-lactamase class C family)